ncbi:MAG TPA: hypothetical protein VGJ45_26185 [Pseudonocardiaceae bacterium]
MPDETRGAENYMVPLDRKVPVVAWQSSERLASGSGGMRVSQRLAERLRQISPNDRSASLIALLERFDEEEIDGQDAERVGVAIAVLVKRGTPLADASALAHRDWRDLLVAAGLAGEDWQERLANYLDLGDPTPPHP